MERRTGILDERGIVVGSHLPDVHEHYRTELVRVRDNDWTDAPRPRPRSGASGSSA